MVLVSIVIVIGGGYELEYNICKSGVLYGRQYGESLDCSVV